MPIDGDPDYTRCEERRKHHRIALYVLLVVFILALVSLCLLKKKENSARKDKLAKMKIKASHEENVKSTRTATLKDPLRRDSDNAAMRSLGTKKGLSTPNASS